VPVQEAASLPRPEPERPRTAHPIRSAIEEVNQIVESLKAVLSEMEEVVELLEMAEVQKEVDEREIAALQQALRRLQRGQETRHGSGPARSPRPEQEPPQ